MRTDRYFSVAVIGGGVVGLAIARELARDGYGVVLFEQHSMPGQENSRTNSGVIHSGIHLDPSMMKAKLARRGAELMEDYSQINDVAYEKRGMLVVVTGKHAAGMAKEFGSFLDMRAHARALGIQTELLSGRTIRKLEPAIRCLFGIRIRDVAIISQGKLITRLAYDCRKFGVELLLGAKVDGLGTASQRTVVRSETHGDYGVKLVINAAGLQADRVAAMGGHVYQVYYYRGEYYQVDPASGISTRSLVYPAKPKGAPGLGVHITPTVSGRLLLGPNAVRVDGPASFDINRTPAEAFYRDVLPFLPNLKLEHLSYHQAGIRPKLTDGKGEEDFKIGFDWNDGNKIPMINLIGIESPGLTAALAIAEMLRDKVRHHLGR